MGCTELGYQAEGSVPSDPRAFPPKAPVRCQSHCSWRNLAQGQACRPGSPSMPPGGTPCKGGARGGGSRPHAGGDEAGLGDQPLGLRGPHWGDFPAAPPHGKLAGPAAGSVSQAASRPRRPEWLVRCLLRPGCHRARKLGCRRPLSPARGRFPPERPPCSLCRRQPSPASRRYDVICLWGTFK